MIEFLTFSFFGLTVVNSQDNYAVAVKSFEAITLTLRSIFSVIKPGATLIQESYYY